MKKRFIDVLVLAFLLIVSVAMGFAYAQSETSVDSRAKDRLEKIEAKLATSTAKQEVKKQDKKGHVVGILIKVSNTSLLISTDQGIKTVATDSSTKFISLSAKKTTIKLSDLKIGERLAAYGLDKKDAEGAAKLIARLGVKTKRHALFGKISSLGSNSITLTHIRNKDKVLGTISTDNSTNFINKDGKIEFSSLIIGDVVAISATIDNQGNLNAKKVFLVPGLGLSKEKTSSATGSSN